jgi:hypothetical protein
MVIKKKLNPTLVVGQVQQLWRAGRRGRNNTITPWGGRGSIFRGMMERYFQVMLVLVLHLVFTSSSPKTGNLLRADAVYRSPTMAQKRATQNVMGADGECSSSLGSKKCSA